ncbi:MAG: hypothetical protein ACYTDT_07015 [Planctomycetota bacterium]|jgi:hypothetical protein
MKTVVSLVLCALALLHMGCEGTQEFLGFSGAPDGSAGWRQDIEASPNDVWEALRMIVRDNGKITSEDPESMRIEGLKISDLSDEDDSYQVKARVRDLSTESEIRTRVHVTVRYADDISEDGDYPEVAREYCYTIRRVLRAWAGGEKKPPVGVSTSSEDPVKKDEAVGYYRLEMKQVWDVSLDVVKKFGEIDEQNKKQNFIRGHRIIPLEDRKDDVRIQLFDRTEGDSKKVKVSVRVVDKDSDPQQEIAKKYLEEIRKELESRFGEKDQE